MKETTKCSVCGAKIKIGETGEEFQGEYYCNHCLCTDPKKLDKRAVAKLYSYAVGV